MLAGCRDVDSPGDAHLSLHPQLPQLPSRCLTCGARSCSKPTSSIISSRRTSRARSPTGRESISASTAATVSTVHCMPTRYSASAIPSQLQRLKPDPVRTFENFATGTGRDELRGENACCMSRAPRQQARPVGTCHGQGCRYMNPSRGSKPARRPTRGQMGSPQNGCREGHAPFRHSAGSHQRSPGDRPQSKVRGLHPRAGRPHPRTRLLRQ